MTKEEQAEFDKLTSKFTEEAIEKLTDFIERVAERAWVSGQHSMQD